MSFDLKIIGLDAVMERIKEAPDKISKIIDAELNAGVHDMEADAKRQAGDYGILHAGIVADGSNLNYHVTAHANYAAYVEFGTGHRVDIPAGYEEFAAQFKGANQDHTGVLARPFMIPALIKNSPLIVNRITKALDTKL